MNVLKVLHRPEYLFRPRQVWARLQRSLVGGHRQSAEVTLPWGAKIRVRLDEHIGSIIWYRGVFDLIVLEAIARLAEPGEVALDIGANIGQMTSLLSLKLGPSGQVLAFEPHPALFAQLSDNVALTRAIAHSAPVTLHQTALSDFEGTAQLQVGQAWNGNQGLAQLFDQSNDAALGRIDVRVTTLDRVIDSQTHIGVCKLDVEGHELRVLRGATTLLRERRIRDVVFEDLDPSPTPVQSYLLEHGFTLFSLHSRLFRPVLSPLRGQPHFNADLDGANFLATLDPERAQARFRSAGWAALR
jgi:FkbM family methyltransferase